MADSDTSAFQNVLTGVSKAKMDRDIITGTLDTLNSNVYGGGNKKSGSSTQAAMSNTYEFSKSVLSAAYGKGVAITDKG